MSTIKNRIAQAIRIFGIFAIVAAFAASAFPTQSYAAEANDGKLIVKVYAKSTTPTPGLVPLSNATIHVFDVQGVAVAKGATDSTGSTTFTLPAGDYKVRVSAPGYTVASDSMTIAEDQTYTAKFQLIRTTRLGQ